MAAISSTSDVYQAPQATLTESTPQVQTSLWSSRGRLGVVKHMAWATVIMFLALASITAAVLLSGAHLGNVESVANPILLSVITLVSLPLVWLSIVMFIRRLHDLNMSAWFILLNLVPILGTLFYLFIICAPGNKEGNKFGPYEETAGWEKAIGIIGLILFISIAILSIVVTVAPSILMGLFY